MQPLRLLLVLAVLAGARAECRDPADVSKEDLNTKYCCCGPAASLKAGSGCCSGRVGDQGECCSEDNPAATTRMLPTMPDDCRPCRIRPPRGEGGSRRRICSNLHALHRRTTPSYTHEHDAQAKSIVIGEKLGMDATTTWCT